MKIFVKSFTLESVHDAEIKAAKKRGGGYINPAIPAEKTYKKAANLGDHNHYSYTQQ